MQDTTTRLENYSRVYWCLAKGISQSVIIGVIAAVLFFFVTPADTRYAIRWSGTCAGWDTATCVLHIIPSVIHWIFYCCISSAMREFYPLKGTVRSTQATSLFVSLIFFFCGMTHLLEALSIFHSAYIHTGIFLAISSVIAIFGAVFLAYDFALIEQILENDRKNLTKLKEKYSK